jgi:O-antigen/teichoic acid export membrane protein
MHESDSVTGTYVETSLTAEVYPASVAPDLEQAPIPRPAGGAAATFTRNSLISVGRLLATTVVALVLPAYLTHRLPVKTYSAWVLLLQMSAYVGYLDFGVQTAVAKYVAEFEAKADSTGAGMRASAGLALMSLAAVLGVILTLTLAWRVPHLFAQMPPALYPSVRISLVLIGVSLSLGLLGSVPSAIFLGLQRYSVPMVISLLNRALYTIVVVSTVFLHGSLAIMGAGVAAVNVATGMIQISAWRRMASHVRLSFAGLDRVVLKQMLSYCSVMGIWTVGMLCVSGLDVTIVGHFDFGQTAFYSIATLPTNFMLSMMGAALGPLLPAASALSTSRSAEAMGELLSRLTRYSTVLLLLCGLPMMLGGYWILSLWVGAAYAAHTIAFLRVLLLANIVRNICLPYATMVVALSRQRVATASAITEAVVNLASSIWLARHYGAMGVALGTLIGSAAGVAMHFGISMGYTQVNFAIPRLRLLAGGIVRPASIAVPSALLLPMWWRTGPPSLTPALRIGWRSALGYWPGLSASRRTRVRF